MAERMINDLGDMDDLYYELSEIPDDEPETVQPITKINDFIYLGSYEDSFNLTDEFKSHGIDVVINCATKIKYPSDMPFEVINCGIDDGSSVMLLENMDLIVEELRNLQKNHKKVYLSCLDGNSSSASIMIYYLMMENTMTFDDAHAHISELRSSVNIHSEFQDILQSIQD